MKVAYLREMHIKTTKRYHFTPTRIAAIKNTENKCWRGCGKTGTLTYCCAAVRENSLSILQNVNHRAIK